MIPRNVEWSSFKRNDGSFGFEEQWFSDEPFELVWCSFGKPPRPNCHCDSEERAVFEARGRIDWLIKSA
jgi:hypothetical protein